VAHEDSLSDFLESLSGIVAKLIGFCWEAYQALLQSLSGFVSHQSPIGNLLLIF